MYGKVLTVEICSQSRVPEKSLEQGPRGIVG